MNTQELLDLANQGNVDAMYNLGVIYSKGDGEKKNKPLAKTWYEKAATCGDSDAKNIVDSMAISDASNRVSISAQMCKAVASFGLGDTGFEYALDCLNDALDKSQDLWSPSENDLFQRREIYRYLGMITYLSEGDDYLRKSEAYYLLGVPIVEAKDLRTVVFYAALMDKLNRTTGNKSYAKKCYDISEQIYKTRFNDIEDNDFKGVFLEFIVAEKILGEVYPKDIDGAVQFNEMLKMLGSNFIGVYENNCQNIKNARQSLKKKGFWGKFFN